MAANKQKKSRGKLKMIPLGGLGEIGKNMTVFECNNEIIIVDCGLAFPDDDMLGIDIVIPDITYLRRNVKKIKGIVITHGHEDHIGALPYVLQEINVPIYATRLTLGLIENKLKEHGLLRSTKRNCVKLGQSVNITSNFNVEFIKINHSIADAAALAITTPVGVIVDSGDFKIDYTPIKGEMANLGRLAVLGEEGVLAMMADSTNVEKPGYTPTEQTVVKKFDEVFSENPMRRIMVATFASNIDRVQHLMYAAEKYDRKVAVIGRSMVNVVRISSELGYLDIPEGIVIDINEVRKYKDGEIAIIMTGSQGERMAALSRMARSEHRQISIKQGDVIIMSSNPIPGNENTVSAVVDSLYRKGAQVVREGTHVSGHAAQEELKLFHSLVKPKFFMPAHGEYRHLYKHAQLARELGMSHKNIQVPAIGDVLELTGNSFKKIGTVPSGKVLVDGLGVGDVGNIVLRDRRHLSQDGLVVVVITLERRSGKVISGPDIISRGFVYVRESEELIEKSKRVASKSLSKCESKKIKEWSQIKRVVRDDLRGFIWQQTKRSPVILPIIMEV